MARDYLSDHSDLMLSIQLIDSRHPPSGLDAAAQRMARFNEKTHIVVATKADKSSETASNADPGYQNIRSRQAK
jgi:GTP-binding protein EngB required for normal cell division